MWKTLSSKIVHKNPWWHIRKDSFQMPTGKKGSYYVLETKGSAFIVAIKDGNILFEKQYRYPINKWTIELPGGQLHEKSRALSGAKKEFEEELGYRAKSMKKIGTFVPFNGVSNEQCVVFLATQLTFVGEKREATEEMTTTEIEIKSAYKMIEDGKIIDGMTIAALAIARPYLIH